MDQIVVRPLRNEDIEELAQMQHDVWHTHYACYSGLYALIRESTTVESLVSEWKAFLDDGDQAQAILGNDRCAFVAVHHDGIVGVGAASAYKYGLDIWQEVDAYFSQDQKIPPKVVKFQNLYIAKAFRAKGIAQYLNIARADMMLAKRYKGIFVAPFSEATKTLRFHERNGLHEICRYPSVTTYKEGKSVMISCCVHKDLEVMRLKWQRQLNIKLIENRAFCLV